jgi:hypothetical protein
MIDKNYRKSALKTYGESCELCGHRTSLEVHHIDYQEHQAMEDELRKAKRADGNLTALVLKAKEQGYDEYYHTIGQLSKNDSTLNTSVLCGNCHSLCHLVDYGKKLLKALKARR